MALTQEQFQKARDAGFSTEQIIGFEKKRLSEGGTATLEEKPIEEKFTKYVGIPRQAQVEEEIKARRNPFEVLKEEARKKPEPFKHPLSTFMQPFAFGMKALDIPRRMIESPIASAGLAAQRGELFTPQAGREIIQGFTGERVAELGDIPFAAGVPKPISSAIGLLSLAGITSPKATFKTGKRMITEPVTMAKEAGEELSAIGQGISKVGRKVTEPIRKVFRTLKPLRGETQTQIGQKISGITEQIGLTKETAQARKATLLESKDIAKYNLNQRLQQADDIFTQNKKVMVEELQNATEQGSLNFRTSLKEFNKAGTDTYGSLIDDFSDDLVKQGKQMTEGELGDILQNALSKSDEQFLPRGRVYQKIQTFNNKYQTKFTMDNIGNIISENADKPVKFQQVISEFKEIRNALSTSAKSGTGYTADDVVNSILQNEYGNWIGKNVPEFAELQKSYAPLLETKKIANRLFKPYKITELETKQATGLLKRFGLGKTEAGEEKLIQSLQEGFEVMGEKIEGVGDLTTRIKEIGNQVSQIDEASKLMKQNISQRLDKLNLSNTLVRNQVQRKMLERVDELAKLKIIEEAKLVARQKADKLLKILIGTGIGLVGLSKGRRLLNLPLEE